MSTEPALSLTDFGTDPEQLIRFRRTPPPGVDPNDIAHIARDLWFLALPIDAFVEDADNARGHSDRNKQAIADSIAMFKQLKTIVYQWRDVDGARARVLPAGNGTLQACRDVGWKYLAACEFEDEDVDQAKAFALADNRSAELAHWNVPVLANTLDHFQQIGVDVGKLGWTDVEVRPILEQGAAQKSDTEKGSSHANRESFLIVIECTDEQHQATVYEALQSQGYPCRIIT